MARRRTDLGPDADEKIRAGVKKGWSAEAIAKALGGGGVAVSDRTVRRRMAELKGKARARPRANVGAGTAGLSGDRQEQIGLTGGLEPLPEDLDAVPAETGLAQIDYWLSIAEKNARLAEAEGESETLVKMVRFAVMLLEAKRKATPIPTPDPNENPDMVRLAEEVAARLHRMVEQEVAA